VRALARALRARIPLAAARRHAEYVLIDHQRVPLGFDTRSFVERHLDRIHHARHGLGYTRHPNARTRVTRDLAPLPPPSLDVRIALRREHHRDDRGETTA
jgi:hypothetical protein